MGGVNHIFVDFENVPAVDLSLLDAHPVAVTLLIGEKQTRLPLDLVEQIHRHAAKVTLVKVGASGRNALDLVLAWHLGRTAERHPTEAFFVVSRDQDFDPLLRHLAAQGISAARAESFPALPFLTPRPARKQPTRRAPAKERVAPAPPPPATPPDARLEKFAAQLQRSTKARPARRKTLLTHLNASYDKTLSEPEQARLVSILEERGIVAIDAAGRVTYP